MYVFLHQLAPDASEYDVNNNCGVIIYIFHSLYVFLYQLVTCAVYYNKWEFIIHIFSMYVSLYLLAFDASAVVFCGGVVASSARFDLKYLLAMGCR
jgi:hypothetical protein